MNKETIAIFHTKLIESSSVPLMAFKALSKFVGPQPFDKGVAKIILVEK